MYFYCKNKLILTFVVILFLPLMQTGFAEANPAAATSAAPVPVGRVVWTKGNSFKAMMPNKQERPLKKLSLIYLHDVLITDNKTQAEIVFTDNTLLTFRPGSQVSIDQYTFNKPKANAKGSVGKYLMSLIEGGFRTITGLIAKNNPSDYAVNTPVATIGVRGTDYAVYFHNNQVYVGEYKGSPCVTNKGSNNKELCLNKQTRYAFVSSKESVPVPLTQRPEVFKETLQVLPAVIAPAGPSTGGPPKGAGNSFCISY